MSMDKNLSMDKILLPLMAILTFVILIGAIGNDSSNLTDGTVVLNESLNPIVVDVDFALANQNLLDVVQLRNSSGATVETFSADLVGGTINVTAGDTTTMFIDYNFKGDRFIDQTAPRVLIGLLTLVIIITVLAKLGKGKNKGNK